MRGTKAIMIDMFLLPEKNPKAIVCADGADHMIQFALPYAHERAQRSPPAAQRLADGWMSEKQFNTLYWPSLKKVNACADQ